MTATVLGVGLVLSATVAMLPSAEAATKVTSTPISYEIVLDGDPVDWQGLPVVYLEESLHLVSVAHNDQDLYLMFRFADERLARQLMSRGVTLWIDGDGKTTKKKELFAVRYPGSVQISEHLEPVGKGHRHQPPDGSHSSSRNGFGPQELTSLRQVPGKLTVIRMGVKETDDESNSEGPSASSRFADEQYCYELRIPFADIGGKVRESNPKKKRKIAIGIQIGGMTDAEREMLESLTRDRMGGPRTPGERGGGRPDGGRPGGGGMGGGRPGGAMPDGRGDGRRPGLDSEILWLSVTLPAAT